MADTAPLLAAEAGVRQRPPTDKRPRPTRSPVEGVPDDWDPRLPYGGRVYLARKKRADPLWVNVLEVAAILLTAAFVYYAYYYFDNLHFHITHSYARLGFPAAQHQVGQKLLQGHGVERDQHTAMEWFKKAADQGHAESAYNLAVGHLKKIRTDLVEKGKVHHLIEHAARNGVAKADKVLEHLCGNGGCDD